MLRRTLIQGGVLTALAACPALAQSYPDRNVRVIVPFAAGGSPDVVGRVIAQALTEHGPLEQLTLASDRAATILCRVTEEYYLLLLLARDGNFGRGRFELRKAAAALEKELM